MSAPVGQGGSLGGSQQGGTGSGSESGGQANPNQATITTTSSQQTTTWSPNSSLTTSRTTSAPTSTSSSTPSSTGSVRTAVIAGVFGGIGAILILSLAIICYLQRRKKKHIAKKNENAQPVTYTGLNSTFAGVPFRQSQASSHDTLLFTTPLESTHSGVPLTGGAGGPGQRISALETDHFLPSYAESQAGIFPEGTGSSNRFNIQEPSRPAPTVSPVSTRAPTDVYNISPQTTGGPSFPSQPERNTMSFPVDHEFVEIRTDPEGPTPIVSPVPRRPLVHRDSLERVVRHGFLPDEGPVMPTLNPSSSGNLRAEALRDSTVLGHENLPRMHQPPPAANNNWADGLERNATQRTVSSVSSMGMSVISDTELERLGVGSRPPARPPVIR